MSLVVTTENGEEVYRWGKHGFPHRGSLGRIMALREGGSEMAKRYKPSIEEAIEYSRKVRETIAKRMEARRVS